MLKIINKMIAKNVRPIFYVNNCNILV